MWWWENVLEMLYGCDLGTNVVCMYLCVDVLDANIMRGGVVTS